MRQLKIDGYSGFCITDNHNKFYETAVIVAMEGDIVRDKYLYKRYGKNGAIGKTTFERVANGQSVGAVGEIVRQKKNKGYDMQYFKNSHEIKEGLRPIDQDYLAELLELSFSNMYVSSYLSRASHFNPLKFNVLPDLAKTIYKDMQSDPTPRAPQLIGDLIKAEMEKQKALPQRSERYKNDSRFGAFA